MAGTLSPEGHQLAEEHVKQAGNAVRFLIGSQSLLAAEAYSRLQSAGADKPAYGDVMRSLFVGIRPSGQCNREYLILAAASALYWSLDDDLAAICNPWLSVLELFHIGHDCGFEESEDGLHVAFLLTTGNHEKSYQIA